MLAPHQNEGAMLAGYRVLVVEDEPLVAESLSDLLAKPVPSARLNGELCKVIKALGPRPVKR